MLGSPCKRQKGKPRGRSYRYMHIESILTWFQRPFQLAVGSIVLVPEKSIKASIFSVKGCHNFQTFSKIANVVIVNRPASHARYV
jgi:hypothetical protein